MNFRKRMMAAMLVVMMQCSLCVASAVADEGRENRKKEKKCRFCLHMICIPI